jgi:phospholipid/cholesterol/gamma-HCH transport system ATP-binding protein
MNSSFSILKFHDAEVETGPPYETGMGNINFELNPGDLFLLQLEHEIERLPLADAAAGLAPAVQGSVCFLGEDWQAMSADHASGLRGQIGRVFEGGGWISNLDVDENIILAVRHHTQRPENEIQQEALNLARLFNLPGLPTGRPSSVRRLDLRKAACIRAFLGQPKLIILEQPTRHGYADLIAPLVNLVQSARERGAALLWTTSDPSVWNHPGIRATVRAKMSGSQMDLIQPGT